MARNQEEKPGGPIQVEVIRLPEAVETLLKDMSERLRALEEREAKLRETVARLEAQVAEGSRPGGLLGAAGAGPVVNPLATDHCRGVRALGEGVGGADRTGGIFPVTWISVERRADAFARPFLGQGNPDDAG